MKLKLTVEVPTSADIDAVLSRLIMARLQENGITVTTATGYAVDVDLVDIERVTPVSLVEEVTS